MSISNLLYLVVISGCIGKLYIDPEGFTGNNVLFFVIIYIHLFLLSTICSTGKYSSLFKLIKL